MQLHNHQAEKCLITCRKSIVTFLPSKTALSNRWPMGCFYPNAFFSDENGKQPSMKEKQSWKLNFSSHMAQKHIAAATTTTPMLGDLGKIGGMFHHEHDSQRQKGDIFPNCLLACTGTITRPAEKDVISFVNREEYSNLPQLEQGHFSPVYLVGSPKHFIIQKAGWREGERESQWKGLEDTL